ncbi:DNA gyrase subunit B [Streptomyces sp. NPDC004610]|uniref:DNA gyrase subunit B n=1 Tax=unclassified Streptomyces TaxID=2593676 RepID=UPI0033BA1793
MSDVSEGADEYGAARVEVLEMIRKRPGMYVGSAGPRGLHHLLCGAADEAVNAVAAGRATRVEIVLLADGWVRVTDDGPGFPLQGDGDTPGLEDLFTRLPPFPPGPCGRERVLVGTWGVGPCVVNALSARLTAEVRRDGVRRVQEYAYGEPLAPPATVGPADGTGTRITFRPDPGLFETLDFSFTGLEQRFRELAFLYPAMDITLTDRRPPGPERSVRLRYPDGLGDLFAHTVAQRELPVPTDAVRFAAEDARMGGTMEVILGWSGTGPDHVLGFANGRSTLDGGTAIEGLRDGVRAALDARARERGGRQPLGLGLMAVVSVKLDSPVYEGPIRGRLAGDGVREAVGERVREAVGAWLDGDAERARGVVAGSSR